MNHRRILSTYAYSVRQICRDLLKSCGYTASPIQPNQCLGMLDGEIWVESTPGQGSVFHFTIPFKRDSEAEYGDILLPPEELYHLNALVVFGNPSVGNALKEILNIFTFEATVVTSCQEAQTEVEKAIKIGRPFQLLLVDWHMPEMDGVEIAQMIKETVNHHEGVPMTKNILMISGDEHVPSKKSKDENIIDFYLNKPINCSILFDVIMEIFGKSVAKHYRQSKTTIAPSMVREMVGGARILLVDDIEINRQVAGEILEGVGLVVETAKDGREAVQKVMKNEYDALLMDIQMSGMDGYAATKMLREIAPLSLPIIAMTAHAMTGDREKCLAAGMNDHVAKPIDKNKLYLTLIKWIAPKEHRGSSAVPPMGKVSDDAYKLPETLSKIDVASALERINGNHKLLRSILLEFNRDFSTSAQEVGAAIGGKRQSDLENARKLVHTVKGIAGNISAQELSRAAIALEDGLRDGEREVWPQLQEQFEKALDQVMASIEMLMVEEKAAFSDVVKEPMEVVPTDVASLAPRVIELARLLRSSNSRSKKSFDDLKPLIAGSGRVEVVEELRLMEEYLDRYDFRKSYASLKKMAEIFDIELD